MEQTARELFQAHAESLFSLPDEVLGVRDRDLAAGAALATVRRAMPSPLDVEAEAARRAAVDPGAWHDPAEVADEAVEAYRTLDRLRIAERIWADGVEQADAALRSALDAEQDRIIAEHLRPVQERILAEVRKVAPALAGLDLADAHLAFSASEKARSAYRTADEAAVKYRRLRQVYSRLVADPDYHERLARYAEIRNIDTIYPEPKVWFGPGAGGTPPWPEHPVGRIVYLVTSEAEVWMPTRIELEDYVAALEEAQREASPVQAVSMPVTTGRTRSGQRPALSLGRKWTEDASDVLG